MKQPFTRLESRALALPNANVDTDTIIRIEHLIDADHARLREHAFEALRVRPDGSLDPDCPFNDEANRDAQILVAGRNFGCGSSREHAVWALQALGLRCVIAESFGDIFAANCLQNGMLPIRATPADVAVLLQAAARRDVFRIDLHECTVETAGLRIEFVLDEWRRQQLLGGLGDIEYTLTLADDIGHWQTRDRARRPWVWLSSAADPGASTDATTDRNTTS